MVIDYNIADNLSIFYHRIFRIINWDSHYKIGDYIGLFFNNRKIPWRKKKA